MVDLSNSHARLLFFIITNRLFLANFLFLSLITIFYRDFESMVSEFDLLFTLRVIIYDVIIMLYSITWMIIHWYLSFIEKKLPIFNLEVKNEWFILL